MVSLTIDGVKVEAPEGTTVLNAAKQLGINIPTLCYMKGTNSFGGCRMCVVDTGGRTLLAACTLPVSEGMEVKQIQKRFRLDMNLELIYLTTTEAA